MVLVIPFDKEFSKIKAADFLTDIVVKIFHPSYFIVGYNHHFGFEREGSPQFLKNFAKKNHVCIEGRDIGSVICPNADIKLFFKCNLEVRAKRRWNEYKKNNSKITLGEVKKALKIRDYSDINRKHSPLRISKDSIVIDTSKLSKKQTLDKISNIIEKKLLLKYGRNYKTK